MIGKRVEGGDAETQVQNFIARYETTYSGMDLTYPGE
jgi:hypothetical protein